MMIDQFAAERRAGTPLLVIETVDQQGTVKELAAVLNGTAPVLTWDLARGLDPVNELGAKLLPEFCKMLDEYSGQMKAVSPALATARPGDMLARIINAPTRTCIIMYNAHRVIGDEAVSQSIDNLRDVFKGNLCTLVMLCPSMRLPEELKQNVQVITEPPPDADTVKQLVSRFFTSVKNSYADGFQEPEDLDKVVDTLIGLGKFSAEQTLAASFAGGADGKTVFLDRDRLIEKQCKAVEQLDGVTVWKGKESFDDIKGCDNVTEFMKLVFRGKKPPRLMIFIDEIEKMMGGAQSDGDSGVSKGIHGEILSFMQDNKVRGLMFVGVPGAAKSAIAKAAGNWGKVPTWALNLEAVKDKFVGESGRKLRAVLDAAKAVGQDRIMFIATSNNINTISPELKRRFAYGTYYFDLPDDETRKEIWRLYIGKNGLEDWQVDMANFSDKDWTGAEIEVCCSMAGDLGIALSVASKRIVPVAKMSGDRIEQLRTEADGKYISAAYDGPYQKVKVAWAGKVEPERALDFAWNKKDEK